MLMMAVLSCVVAIENYHVAFVGEEITQIGSSFFISSPQTLDFSKGTLFSVDFGNSSIIGMGQDNSFFVFSGKGDGPGEIRRPYSSFVYNEKLHVVHNSKRKVSVFNPDGSIDTTETLILSGSIVLSLGNTLFNSLVERPASVQWNEGKKVRDVIDLNPGGYNDNPRSYLGSFNSGFALIITRASSINRVYYASINMEKKLVDDIGSFETFDKTLKKDYPQDIPKGARFQAYTVRSLTSGENGKFIILETSIKPNPKFVFFRIYDAQKRSMAPRKLFFEGLGSRPYALLNLKNDLWVAAVSGKIIFFKMAEN